MQWGRRPCREIINGTLTMGAVAVGKPDPGHGHRIDVAARLERVIAQRSLALETMTSVEPDRCEVVEVDGDPALPTTAPSRSATSDRSFSPWPSRNLRVRCAGWNGNRSVPARNPGMALIAAIGSKSMTRAARITRPAEGGGRRAVGSSIPMTLAPASTGTGSSRVSFARPSHGSPLLHREGGPLTSGKPRHVARSVCAQSPCAEPLISW